MQVRVQKVCKSSLLLGDCGVAEEWVGGQAIQADVLYCKSVHLQLQKADKSVSGCTGSKIMRTIAM